jgi:imidazolonepropionase-like amidohydrolase
MTHQLMTVFVLGLAALFLVPNGSLAQPEPDSTSLLLTNARLVDPETKTVRRGALRIEGERIAAVLDRAPAEFNGRVLDLDGKWVLPGLVDAHVHSWGNAGPAFQRRQMLQTSGTAKVMLYSGVTAFLDLFSPEDYIFDLRNRQRSQGFLGAQSETTSSLPLGADIYAAGPILTCPDGHGTEYGAPTRTLTGPGDARQTVDSLAARNPDVVKLAYHPYRTDRYPSIGRATMTAIVDAAHRHNLKTVVHVESWQGAHETIAAGVDAITHTPPTPLPDSTLAAMQEQGTAWIPTLAVHTELAHWLQHPSRLDNDLVRAVADSTLLAAYRDTSGLPDQIRAWMDRQARHRTTRLDAVKKAAEAGVPILAGTDAGNPGLFQGYSLHRELSLLTQAGLSNWEALAAATTAPGRLLDAPLGLQPGDRANLLVLNASPIAEIRHTQNVHRVIYRGRVVDRHRLLDEATPVRPTVPTR